jgi:hypothetical protein
VESTKASQNKNIHGQKKESKEENPNKEGGRKFPGGKEGSVVEKGNSLLVNCISTAETAKQEFCCLSRNDDKEIHHVHQPTGEGQQMPLQYFQNVW